MYRSLVNCAHHVQLNRSLTKVKCISNQLNHYHNDSHYYGYRPKMRRESDFRTPVAYLIARQSQMNVSAWIEAFRVHGHRSATINPIDLQLNREYITELEMARFGLSKDQELSNLEGLVSFDRTGIKTAGDLKNKLNETYCQNVSAEFAFIEDEHERRWFAENYEKMVEEKSTVSSETKRDLARLLIQFQSFDNFMNMKLPSIKRYGGEGAESMVAFFRTLFSSAAHDEVDTIVLGMPHRGKLNSLTTVFNQRPAKIFRKYKGLPEFGSDVKAMMDIPNHFNASEDLEYNGKKIHLSMLHNPSHLEAVNPVSMGKTRSKQWSLRDGAFNDDQTKEFGTSVINVQMHGDAAIAGQGINQECLMMSSTPNFYIGGTIHMVVNNHIGFTNPGERGRSSRYCTDIAKSINAPIIHVNSDDVEMVGLVTKLAYDYQRTFRKDIFIDFNCFRKLGHNELDDPTVTNPLMYRFIQSRKSVPELYSAELVKDGVMSESEVEEITKKQFEFLNSELLAVESYEPEKSYFKKQWEGFVQAPRDNTIWDTGVNFELLSFIGKNSVYFPNDFAIHPHLQKTFVNARIKRLAEGNAIDWATAEALAFGSLMYQGINVRLSGQDVGRGTFAQRHAMLVDQETNEVFIPINAMKGGLGGKLEVANSILSEEAVLGFEYGMSIDNPNNLIIWESQFGDFFNGAQILIDTFIASGETKWMTCSGLVMLLPHGYDGAASEHSSCRLERFLQLTDSKETQPDGDDVNMHICYPTTPAQYFHLMRRQMLRNFRKPLIVVGPKTLLRSSDATSSYAEFLPGTHFQSVLPDTTANPKQVKKLIFCSGKHYYNLNNERIAKKIEDVAIIRVESLCPFPVQDLQKEISKYKNVKQCIWSQEEQRNMGAWSFIQPRFENMLGKRIKYCGRSEAATPAVGVSTIHQKEVAYIVTQPFIM